MEERRKDITTQSTIETDSDKDIAQDLPLIDNPISEGEVSEVTATRDEPRQSDKINPLSEGVERLSKSLINKLLAPVSQADERGRKNQVEVLYDRIEEEYAREEKNQVEVLYDRSEEEDARGGKNQVEVLYDRSEDPEKGRKNPGEQLFDKSDNPERGRKKQVKEFCDKSDDPERGRKEQVEELYDKSEDPERGRKKPVQELYEITEDADVDHGACVQPAAITAPRESWMRSSFYCKAGTRMDELRTKASEVGNKNNCDVQCIPSTVMTNQASVNVQFAEIQTFKVDAIVNFANQKLNLKVGKGLSTVILKAAGEGIQDEVHRNYPNGLQPGEVGKSGPGNISTCKAIYHGVLPMFGTDKHNKDECYNALVMVVLNVLLMASTDGYTSVAFPALGTGILGYPVPEVVQLMFLAVSQFFDSAVSSIKKVFFVIYPKTDPFLKQFWRLISLEISIASSRLMPGFVFEHVEFTAYFAITLAAAVTLPALKLFLMEQFSHQFHTVKVDSSVTAHKELSNDPAKTCEARFRIGTTFLQIINGDIRSFLDVADVNLILWREDYLNRHEDNPVVSCFDKSVQENIYTNYAPDLRQKRTKVEEDRKSFMHTRLIHLYCKDDTDDVIARAIARGIKQIKDDVAVITISIRSDGSRPWQPHIAANAIIKTLQKVSSTHQVVQVILQESYFLEPFLQTVLDHTHSVHVEPSVTKVFDTVFPLRDSRVAIGDVTITVTPRLVEATDDAAKESLDKVAMELKRDLGITLMYNMDSHEPE